MCGLSSIPFIITPIDTAIDYLMEEYITEQIHNVADKFV